MAQFLHLQQQFKLLADFFEDTAEGVFQAGSDASRKESAFALRYAAKETVIIPDFIPEIGYADDSLIVRTVLSRRRLFSRRITIFEEFVRRKPPYPFSPKMSQVTLPFLASVAEAVGPPATSWDGLG